MRYYALDKLINLYDGYRQAFIIESKQLLLIEERGRQYLIQSNCPHMDWPLINAPIQEEKITCPKHNLSFYLKNGRPCLSNKLACRDLKVLSIAYLDNTVGFYSS